jgi:hypothetical protein
MDIVFVTLNFTFEASVRANYIVVQAFYFPLTGGFVALVMAKKTVAHPLEAGGSNTN